MSAPVSARKINQILRAHNAAALQGITLRDYQRDAIDGVLAEVRKGNRRVLLVAPTGAGKTVMFAALAVLFHSAGLRVLVVAHRKELIEQAVRKLRASGVAKVGVWRGKKNSSETDAQVMVAAIQALRSAKIDADLVIVDESHHVGSPSFDALLDLYPDAVHLGATATPWRGDGKGLGHYFQAIVTATTVRALTDAGHLARVRMFTHPHTLRDLDLRGVKTSGGDYQTAALSERVDRPNLLGDIVEHWTTHANGARSLVFAASVEHSQHIAARFRAAGITAEHLDGTTPEDQRDAMLARLRSGETRVVSNYDVLTEGFDAPSVGCVILARPTQRLRVYLQAVGRGLRVEAEKPSVVVLDHAGLCLRFGLPDEERPCTLECAEEREATGEPRVRRCPECGLCVPVATRVCPECAESLRRAERVLTEEPHGALVEIVCGSSAGPHMITCNGKTMTRSQWAVELNMSPSLVTFRVNKGIPLDAPVARKERITFNGRSLFITEWAEEIGIDPESLRLRIRGGMTLEEALSKPSTQVKRLTYKGKTMTVGEWAKEIGISESAIHFRLRHGLPIEQVLAPPKSYARHTKITRAGETQTLEEWARRIGVSVSIILRRIRGGASPEEALAPTATVAARVAKSMTTRRQSLDLITYQGRSMPAYAWAKEIGVSASTIRRRRAEGLPVEKVLAPATASAERTARAAEGRRRSARKLKVGGVELTLPQWAKRTGVSTATIERRLARGMAPEECVATGGGRAS